MVQGSSLYFITSVNNVCSRFLLSFDSDIVELFGSYLTPPKIKIPDYATATNNDLFNYQRNR